MALQRWAFLGGWWVPDLRAGIASDPEAIKGEEPRLELNSMLSSPATTPGCLSGAPALGRVGVSRIPWVDSQPPTKKTKKTEKTEKSEKN